MRAQNVNVDGIGSIQTTEGKRENETAMRLCVGRCACGGVCTIEEMDETEARVLA